MKPRFLPNSGFWIRATIFLALCLAPVSAFAKKADERGDAGGGKGVVRVTAKIVSNGRRADFRVPNAALFDESLEPQLRLRFGAGFDERKLRLVLTGLQLGCGSDSRRSTYWLPGDGRDAVLTVRLSALDAPGRESWLERLEALTRKRGKISFWVRAPQQLLGAELVFGMAWAPPQLPPPRAKIESVTPPERVTSSRSISIAFSGPANAARFECSLDRADFAPCTSPFQADGLRRGPHLFRVRAYDSNGRRGPASGYVWLIWGTTQPARQVVILGAEPADAVTNRTSMSVRFEVRRGDAVDTAAVTECRWDDGAFQPCASPATVENVTEGAHRLEVREAESGSVASHAWRVDVTPPALDVTAKPAAVTSQTDATFAFTSDEPATFECRIDGNATPCTSPWSVSGLAEGAHVVEIRAVDSVGNTAPPFTHAWTVDATPPVIAVQGVSPAVSPSSQTFLTLSYSVSESAEVTCIVDGVTTRPCASPLRLDTVAEGAHEIVLSAVDAAGNVADEVRHRWTVDVTAPQVSAALVEPASLPTNLTSARLAVSATETAALSCRLNDEAPFDCGESVLLDGLAEGQQRFTVTAIDAAGNVSSEATVEWTIDLTAPSLRLDEVVPDAPITESTSLSVSFSADERASFECTLDDALAEACESPYAINGLAEGEHRLVVRAKDTAGNASPPVEHRWKVAFPVQAVISAVSDPRPVTPAWTMSFTFAGEGALRFECSLDGGQPAECVSPFATAELTDGEHRFQVRAVNWAGVAGPWAQHEWRIETPPAVAAITSIEPAGSIVATGSMRIAFEAAGATGFVCSLDGAVPSPCTSPMQYDRLADGERVFRVRALNARGLAGPEAVHAWSVVTRLLSVTSLQASPAGALVASSTMTFAFTGEEGATFQCSLDGRPFIACASPHTVSGLPDGAHGLRVRALNQAGTPGEPTAHAWVSDTRAPVARIVSVNPDSTPTSSSSIRVTFDADEPNARFECALDGGAATPCVSPWTVTNLTDGEHGVAIWAIDPAGNRSPVPATYTWRVDTTYVCSNLAISQITAVSAVVTWDSSAPGTSEVRWGAGSVLNRTSFGPAGVTRHSVFLDGLTPNIRYTVQATSQSPDGRQCFTARASFLSARP